LSAFAFNWKNIRNIKWGPVQNFDKLVVKQLFRKSLKVFWTSINIEIIERLHEKSMSTNFQTSLQKVTFVAKLPSSLLSDSLLDSRTLGSNQNEILLQKEFVTQLELLLEQASSLAKLAHSKDLCRLLQSFLEAFKKE
jgi:hypothetical protein